jgi:cytochrome oxidase assembly protein ShyY1
VQEALPAPGRTPGTAGPPAPAEVVWSRVGMTGRYDQSHEILARGRTVDSRVGFEVLTPLVLADGSAVLVDRGWIAPAPGDATARPDVPPAPQGEVTVTGRVARGESRAGSPERIAGRMEVRRIGVQQLAAQLPYPMFDAYVLLDPGQPGADGLTAVPSPRQGAWQNAGYVVQWWLFAALTLAGFIWLARREAHGPPPRHGHDRAGLVDGVPA